MIALIIISLLELKLDHKFSNKKILKSLSNYNCLKIKGEYYMLSHYDECNQQFGKLYDVSVCGQFKIVYQIKNILKLADK